jgi:tRNA nucleotidyltransferase/poly(A) polymerase
MKKYNTFIRRIYENKIDVEMPLPQDILNIAREFHNAGKDLFVVGGCVRDFIQSKIPHDYDLVTNAMPEESKKILKDWNVSDEQGKNFGVLRIYTADEPLGYELAVYRRDISKGRDVKGDEPKVEIGEHITIEDDVKRRDFSSNSLFYDINKKQIIDLTGGVSDIKNNIIRAVGSPSERFNEDRLRILRCFRFSARANAKIDPETAEAIRKDNRLRGIGPKDDVSQERIIEEVYKLIDDAQKANSTKIITNYFEMLESFDMFKQMFPDMKMTVNKVGTFDKAIIFLDLFWNNDIKEKTKTLNKLKFPTDLISEMLFLQDYTKNDSVYKLAKFKEKFKERRDYIDNLLRNFAIYKGLDTKFCERFLQYCNDGFIVDGKELEKQGFKGREIENEKERIENLRFKTEYMK